MHEPTRFGGFLLLKKLSEDPLGETYRAGRLEGTAVAELVLLRTYDLAGSTSGLAEVLREAAGPTRRIRGPGLAYALAGGEVGGVPYSIYEYTTGWSLLHLLESTRTGFARLERDHGLLIVERLAKGLAVVHQADPSADRNHHGFVVPQNVRLSSEGEIGLMGFETGPFLARLTAHGHLAELHPYVSPEVRSGAPPTPADDVYSLGAVLWHLLIGQPPPLQAESGLAASLAAARMGNDEVLPAGLGELLQSSLAPQRVRFPDAHHWHRKLAEWMGRNEVKTTHFDLAFFIHEIFRTAIRREEEELEGERHLDTAPAPPEPDGPEISDIILRPDLSGMVQRPPPAAQMTGATPASGPESERSPSGSKAPLLGLAALIALVVAGGWYWLRGDAAPEPAPVQAPPREAPAPPPASASDALELAQGELERLVQERARGLSDQIAAEYDEQIRSLREQLKAAQAAEVQAIREASKRSPPAGRDGGAAPPPAPAVEAGTEPSPPGGGTAERDPPAEVPAASPGAPPPPVSLESSSPLTPPPASPDETPPEAAPPPPEPEATPEVIAPPEPPPDAPPPPPVSPPLVTPPPPVSPPPPSPAESVTPPRRIKMPEARYPQRARQHRKEATVLVKVLVNTDGRVIDAEPVLDRPDTYGFIQEALRAAGGAEFEPAESGGLPIRMWTTVVITFKLGN